MLTMKCIIKCVLFISSISDPVGIPLNVISTDYNNYALVYGCKNNTETDLKYRKFGFFLNLSKTSTTPNTHKRLKHFINTFMMELEDEQRNP